MGSRTTELIEYGRGVKECMIHASAVGRQVEAKWNSNAVSSRQVGQRAKTFTAPLISINLTHCSRSGQVIGCAATASVSCT